ncbi:hypothetical protein EC968_009329 [Mortierella alpina]|nr:hypothetical protein EC968_009329 [Mortierella alpina]
MPEFKDTLIDALATLYFVDQSPEIGAVLLPTIEHAAKIAIEQESLRSWPELNASETLANLSTTFNRLKKMASKSIVIPSSDSKPLEELCGDIIQQIEDFQKDTPSKKN